MTGAPSTLLDRTSLRAPRIATSRALPPLPSLPQRVADALRAVAGGADESRLAVRQFADGRQARLFSVRAHDDSAELIVKAYRGDGADERRAARDEFECLGRLHDRLDGTTRHGWTVRCPRPLHFCDRSLALVMTRVPGQTLSRHLAEGAGPSPQVLESISRAIHSCLTCYWSGEPRLYGDLILNNVLCDLPSRTLSLVDPGMPERFYLCETAPRHWYPASRDLAFLLFWTASLIRPSILHPVLHARQKRMATRIVRTFLNGLGSETQRREATAEIEACVRLHLGRIRVSASPGGLWRRFVQRAATRTIDRMLQELRGGTCTC
jgi:hypothetical protein